MKIDRIFNKICTEFRMS